MYKILSKQTMAFLRSLFIMTCFNYFFIYVPIWQLYYAMLLINCTITTHTFYSLNQVEKIYNEIYYGEKIYCSLLKYLTGKPFSRDHPLWQQIKQSFKIIKRKTKNIMCSVGTFPCVQSNRNNISVFSWWSV